MPKISPEKENMNIELVRQAMILNPGASLVDISGAIAKTTGEGALDLHYISKLKKRIIEDRVVRFNKAEINERIALMEDMTRTIQTKMWSIVTSKISTDKNKIAAGKIIIDAETKLLSAQMDAGIYKRQLGEIEVKDSKDAELLKMMKAMQNYGIIEIESKIIKPKQIANGNKNKSSKV